MHKFLLPIAKLVRDLYHRLKVECEIEREKRWESVKSTWELCEILLIFMIEWTTMMTTTRDDLRYLFRQIRWFYTFSPQSAFSQTFIIYPVLESWVGGWAIDWWILPCHVSFAHFLWMKNEFMLKYRRLSNPHLQQLKHKEIVSRRWKN